MKSSIRSRRYVAVLICLFVSLSCAKQESSAPVAEYPLPVQPDYSRSETWYKEQNASTSDRSADVFYVVPTCIWDWTDSSGVVIHFGDVYNDEQRQAIDPSLRLAADIFAQQSNFYAPYYRQITLESWIEGEDTVVRRFPYAMQDVQRAFDYYLKNENGGRPFVLAGFSQGAKAVVELLKGLPDSVYSRMVAAYVIGYRVTEEEARSYRTIVAARDSADVGVTVCYNSVADLGAICPVLSPSSFCINPVNWRTDSVRAQLNDSVTVRVDTAHHVLLVEGFDPERYYHPSLGALFRVGNYHLQELEFYRKFLTRNVKQRIEAFYDTRR